jgi:hypothetical protein
MLNMIGFVLFVWIAAYESIFKHNETKFVHWMLWAIVCGIVCLLDKDDK